MINFKSIPFFKILLPYLLGVLCALQIGVPACFHYLFFSVFLTWLASFVAHRAMKNFSALKILFIALTNLLLFVTAFESITLYNVKNHPDHYSHYLTSKEQSFIGSVSDIPVSTEKFYKIPLNITCVSVNGNWHYSSGNTIIYVRRDSVMNFDIGNRLLITQKFATINEPKNPLEFNYKQFLEYRHIFHVVYAKPEDAVVFSESDKSFNLQIFGATIKHKLVEVLKGSQLSQSAFAICSALLVGYDDEIESEVMQSFSHSGTLHILSVSGMHTAVLYSVLLFLFSLVDKHERFKKLRFYVIMSFLLLFVLITGISPSVLRAALMLALMLLGQTLYRQGNAYNTLLMSAFVLLLFNPFLVKDIGFLLSYLAVFGIMYLYPILATLYTFPNKVFQWCWSGTLISVSATLFTLPVSLYCFHQFPIWFVLSNLVIIPLSMIMMAGAAVLLLVHKVAFLSKLICACINYVTEFMIWLASLTDSESVGYIDYIPFTATDAFFSCFAILFALAVIYNKRYHMVLAFCAVLILWLSLSIYTNYLQMRETELLVFHLNKKTAFALREGQTVYYHSDELSDKEFQKNIKPYLMSISNLKLIHSTRQFRFRSNVTTTSLNNASLVGANDYHFLIVSKNRPVNLTTNDKRRVLVIADCSNSYKFVSKLKKDCASKHVSFYDVKESGAFEIKLE